MKTTVISLYFLFLAGCTATTIHPDGKFVFATASDGSVYRTNKSTGETWRVVDDRFVLVREGVALQLQVGQKYFIERNRSVTYLGDGKFTEPVSDFSQLWN